MWWSSATPVEDLRADPPAVHVVNVTIVLDDEVVLRRLDLIVPAGGTTAVVGASGAGKTTLLRSMAGLRRPDSGRIDVGDRSLYDLRRVDLRDAVGRFGVLLGGSTVFDSWSFGSMTVRDAVSLPLRLRGVEEDVVALRTGRCLADLGLTEVADRMPEQLAGHTRRRAAIARALVGDPRLILLDDPDSGLDAPLRARVVDAVRAAQARTGATVLLATHDLDLARSLADTVAVLGEGRILRTGTPAEVLAGVHSSEDLAAAFPGAADPDAVGAALGGRDDPRGPLPRPGASGRALLTAAGFVLLVVVVVALLLTIVR